MYTCVPLMIKMLFLSIPKKDQRVENAGVAIVKGANERNEFFEKINKQ